MGFWLWKKRNKKDEIIDEEKPTVNFAQLLEKVALVNPKLRVRFSTSHPKDMTDEVLEIIEKHENICNYIHLPVQSGNTDVLKRMNRGYSREWYLDRISAIRRIITDCAISTDIIAGFCNETDEEHNDTVSLLKEVKFDVAYMFKYSERPKTLAQRKFEDSVPEEVKSKRLREIMDEQFANSAKVHKSVVGNTYEILIEDTSKKDENQFKGRNSQNMVAVFPKLGYKKGDYVNVKIESCTSATLIGNIVE